MQGVYVALQVGLGLALVFRSGGASIFRVRMGALIMARARMGLGWVSGGSRPGLGWVKARVRMGALITARARMGELSRPGLRLTLHGAQV